MTQRRSSRVHFTDEDLARVIDGSLGNISYIARRLGVTRVTVYNRVRRSQKLQALLDAENETMLDNAENELTTLMNPSANPDVRSRLEAIKFYLNGKGRRRGWGVQSQQVDLHSDQVIQPIIKFIEQGVDNDAEAEE